LLLAHRPLGAGLVVLKGGSQTNQDFGAGLEKDLSFWFIDFVDVAAKMIDVSRASLRCWRRGLLDRWFAVFEVS
jgi:hypothetical protein